MFLISNLDHAHVKQEGHAVPYCSLKALKLLDKFCHGKKNR